ncbi:MAG: PA2169 family four-helix-bundle protein [Fermentimonas sp.]|nr:PA2169 family four-helix-bundle protein [Fermentimonas sp.]
MIAEKQGEILNDLIKINNDRMEGYLKAIEQLNGEDIDLKNIFQLRIEQSQTFHNDLVSEVALLGEEVATGTLVIGKIYRAWMDVKVLFSGNDRKAVLDSCLKGEGAALAAYNSALESGNLSWGTREILNSHRADIQKSYDELEAMRDLI